MRLWLRAIEDKRKKMYNSAEKKGFTSKETIQFSQELDHLLNLYQERKKGLFDLQYYVSKAILTIKFIGEYDYSYVTELEKLYNEIDWDRIRLIRIDFSELSFIDSSGLGSLVNLLYRSYNLKIKVQFQNLSEIHKNLFKMIGLSDLLLSLN